MAVNPPLNPIMCLIEGNGDLSLRDRAGIGTAIGSGALRYAPAPGARVNYAYNPRFASNLTGWSINLGGVTITRQVDGRFAGGTSCLVVVDGSGGNQGVQQDAMLIPKNVPDSAFTHMTLSFDLIVESGDGSQIRGAIGKYSADGSFVSGGSFTNVAAPGIGVLTRMRIVIAAPASLVGVDKLGCSITNLNAAACSYSISNITFEFGNVASTPYFSGVWLDPRTGQIGTANASPSVSRAVFRVEEATTNLISNPSAEAAVLGSQISTWNAAVLTKDTTRAYQGSASVKVVTPGSVQREGVAFLSSTTALGFTGVRTHRGSIYLSGSGVIDVYTRWQFADLSTLDSTPVTVTLTNTWQRVEAATLSTDGSKTADYVFIFARTSNTVAAQAVTFFADCAQIEEKTYATSYCDGSLGTGYSWAGTAHASASSRATTGISAPHANRANPQAGAVVANVRREGAYSNFREIVKLGTFGVGEFANLYLDNVSQRITAYTKQGSNTARFAQAALPAPELDTFVKVTADWNTATVRVGRLTGTLASTARVDTGIGATFGATNMEIGIDGTLNNLNGSIGPVVIYDVPLSDARRSLVNAAIDSNGATDLWTLLEEWEAVGLPIEPALQFGQATAGVTAQGQAMDLLALQSGQGTAGVKAEGQPIDLLQLQDMTAVGLDGERVIPVPSIREPILAGRS